MESFEWKIWGFQVLEPCKNPCVEICFALDGEHRLSVAVHCMYLNSYHSLCILIDYNKLSK